MGRLSSARLAEFIIDILKPVVSSSKCFGYPMDITPVAIERSTALHSLLSHGPVLLLTGPHLSLLGNTEEDLYLLRSLQLAYTSCANNAFTTVQQNNSGSLRTMGKEAHKLLHAMAFEARKHRLQTASVCPHWMRKISIFLGASPTQICGIKEDNPPGSKGTESVDEDKRNSLMRAMDEIQSLLTNSSTREAVTHTAFELLRKLSAHEPPRSSATRSTDSALTVEYMQLTCCRWLHLHVQSAYKPLIPNDIDAPGLLLHETSRTSGVPPTSVADRLACKTNRTLQFHTLDSHLNPTLAWELAGYDSQSQLQKIGAAIVDQQYHSSSLRPWRRHPRPTKPSSKHPNLISIHTAKQLKKLLDARTHIQSSGEHDRVIPKVNSSLVLLYYSRSCGFSTQGDSLLWHFESAARNLVTNPAVVFARVDVSSVELPWELRVARIPSVIVFPGLQSTYSSVFPLAASMDDLSSSLTQFVLAHSKDHTVVDSASSFASPHAFSFRAREALLSVLNPFTQRLAGFTMEHIHKHCDMHMAVAVRSLCRGGVRLAINAHRNRLLHAQMVASGLMQRIEGQLNTINSQLMSMATRLYASRIHFDRLSSLMKVYSDLWVTIRSYQLAIQTTQRFLSSGTLS
ncbi:unnamed protein product [Echinostoma caproni]|uniref:Thioredoxin domain-containing protein n=1 Tax=Echinostoma caproni TaxID=27848 RepID=A0A3P8G9S4_9TREM|nr:unnamed protein product [Echinostoma caproni]